MKCMRNDYAEGDNYYLFLNLKIDPSLFQQLPIELAPGIFLARTPQHALAQAGGTVSTVRENIALAAWIYPGFGLGSGIVNVCIKIDNTIPTELRERYFWLMVSALYLTKPLYINIAGGFTYGNEKDGFLGRSPGRIPHRSNISINLIFNNTNPTNLLRYNLEDFKQAAVFFTKFVQIFNSRKIAPRPYYVLKSFFESTLWERSIYASTSFSKLFPLIDSLTGNPTHKHELQTSLRLSLFLREVPSLFLDKPLTAEQIKSRLADIWRSHRAPDLHGYLKEPDLPSSDDSGNRPVDESELKDLFDLMEFARVGIIKMLMLDEISFNEYCKIPIPRRKFISEDERKKSEMSREVEAKRFFENKSYINPKEMFAYTDFVAICESIKD